MLFGMAEHSSTGSELPAAVRAARLARGISLRGLAADIGVSPATLSAVETGRTPLTVARLQRIAERLDMPAARLLRGDVALPGAASGVDPGEWRRYDDLALGAILEAAARLFVRHGFHATSMREVSAAADLSVAGIYHHYTSKQQLLVALMDVTMTEIRWRLLAARDEGSTKAHGFALMVESLALFHAVRGDLAFLGASEMRGITEPELSRITALRDEVQHLLDEQAFLAFPGVEVRTPCRAIATMCTSLPSWFRSDGSLSPHQIAKQYADLALKMLQ
jgi:AcrR family transcriptional regulator/lambda repressor-like predicted transcriptional regulator